MLFKVKDLQKIKSGEISLAFRKWQSPRVKKGSLIKTAIGRVEILDIREARPEAITPEEAQKAGQDSLEALHNLLEPHTEGQLYRIEVRYHSPDPRLQLREQAFLPDAEFFVLQSKLSRMDRLSGPGPWTRKILEAIRDYPMLRAADLAEKTGFTRDWLKPNVRKLKNLGLTISHETGYSLSNRGQAYLMQLAAKG